MARFEQHYRQNESEQTLSHSGSERGTDIVTSPILSSQGPVYGIWNLCYFKTY
jgi:hypothetical protein